MITRHQFVQFSMSDLADSALPSLIPAQLIPDDLERWTVNDCCVPRIIGVGSAGCNAVAHMMASNVQNVKFIGSNTEDDIRAALEGSYFLFIIGDMRSDALAAAEMARIAHIGESLGTLTVCIVTVPVDFDGSDDWEHARADLSTLQTHVDSLIVIRHETLHQTTEKDGHQDDVYAFYNEVVKNVVSGISTIINVRDYVCVDAEDVRTSIDNPGLGVMAMGIATGPERGRLAAEQAIACPLLQGANLSNALGILVIISGPKETFTLSEFGLAMKTLRNFISPDVHLICGASHDETLNGSIRVILLATGLVGHS
jgi:cell division protein FtsZ